MISNISEELNPTFKPVVLIKSNEKPSDAIGPDSLVGGCSMAYFAKAVVERKTTFFGLEHGTCAGISSGLGWIEELNDLALDFQATFLALGVDSAKNREEYIGLLENKSERVKEMFLKGERFYKDYDTAYLNIKSRPLFNNGDYAIFKPIELVNDEDDVLSVIFTVNTVELIGLLILDGSHRCEDSYILTPQSSGCQAIGCHVFNQNRLKDPHPVLGLIDLACKKYLTGISDDYLTFSIPWGLFLKLEKISKNSIFQSALWKKLKK